MHSLSCVHIRRCGRELDEVLAELDDRIDHLQPMLGDQPDAPLHVHARYTRIEIQAALNDGTGCGRRAGTAA